MNRINLLMAFMLISFLSPFSFLNAQNGNHSKIKSFAIKFDDGNLAQVSTTLDSTIYINYIVELKDTSDVKKIFVRISSGQNINGDIYQVSYLINSQPVANSVGKIIFRRERETLYILTVSSTQLADLNFEVATEDYNGQLSPYLSWKK